MVSKKISKKNNSLCNEDTQNEQIDNNDDVNEIKNDGITEEEKQMLLHYYNRFLRKFQSLISACIYFYCYPFIMLI